MRLGTDRGTVRPSAPGSPHIYTVPPGQPFLTRLAEALIGGELPHSGGAPPDPMQLADITVLLPTRVRPIFAASEDANALATLDYLASDEGGLRPAIGEIERQLALTKLVLAWGKARGGEDVRRHCTVAAARTA